MRALSAAAVLTLALTLSACGGDDEGGTKLAEKVLESQDGVKDVDIDDDSYTVETDEGTISAGSGTEIPDGFPEDVPLPSSDYTIASAVEQGEEIALMLTATDGFDFDAEKASMESELTDAGYSIDEQSRTSASGMEMFSIIASADGLQVSITAVGDGEEINLMYAVSPSAS